MVRETTGFALILFAGACLLGGIYELSDHDYLSSMLLLMAGLAVLRGGVELLRGTVGE